MSDHTLMKTHNMTDDKLLEKPAPTTPKWFLGKGSRAARGRFLRILCAEDNEHIAEILKKVLSDAGHEVECVLDGQAAWDRLSVDPSAFDLLITDHQMPRLSGLGLVKKTRATVFSGRIIVESGNLTPEIEKAYLALRVDRIVGKTLHPDFIRELIAGLK